MLIGKQFDVTLTRQVDGAIQISQNGTAAKFPLGPTTALCLPQITADIACSMRWRFNFKGNPVVSLGLIPCVGVIDKKAFLHRSPNATVGLCSIETAGGVLPHAALTSGPVDVLVNVPALTAQFFVNNHLERTFSISPNLLPANLGVCGFNETAVERKCL